MAQNQSLQRGLAILGLLDRLRRPVGIREIARQLELSPSIVQRLVSTLAAEHFVVQEPGNLRYRLGYRAMSLGSSLLEDDDLVANTMPELRKLADEHMLNGFLSVVADDRLVYVLAIQSSGPVAIRTAPGASAQFHSTAMGKALLAGMSDAEARRLLGREPLPRLTDRTITDPEQVMAELAQVRQQGYAVSKEENLPGIVAVGAGIRDDGNRVVAALSAAFAPNTVPNQSLAEAARLVVQAAAAISRGLGCPTEPRLAAGQS